MARRRTSALSGGVRAAQYLRMSTAEQTHSPESQGLAIAAYAKDHGLEIVRTYEDMGRSGLTLNGRPALQSLISDVTSGQADFKTLLVYDVSRWGRFQDVDAGAYYEYMCRKNGVDIIYCVEPFSNEIGSLNSLLKNLKRIMAAEFSRELSVKCFAGHCRSAERGHRQGSSPGLGLRRMIVTENGVNRVRLEAGEQKATRAEHVTLVPGPPAEIRLVRRIFLMFTTGMPNAVHIAERLNAEGLRTASRKPWSGQSVMRVLKSEKYVGISVWNKRSAKLKGKTIINPPDIWVVKHDAFAPIISRELFDGAKSIFEDRWSLYDRESAVEKLRDLYVEHGYLSIGLLDSQNHMPKSRYYVRRFGSLHKAFAVVGCSPRRNSDFIHLRQRRHHVRPSIIARAVSYFGSRRIGVSENVFGALIIEDRIKLTINVARCQKLKDNDDVWIAGWNVGPTPDFTIIARLEYAGDNVRDYCLVERNVFRRRSLRLRRLAPIAEGFWQDDRLENLLGRAVGREGESA